MLQHKERNSIFELLHNPVKLSKQLVHYMLSETESWKVQFLREGTDI